ncbi:unnamed protein product [Enterobius vermicularis]|uniref:CACTA en-spm transposon protein n=1 Tax=Enterobius vermicularis TaxID=51028 RepID=A0A0N4UX79_ENTVE|nr:unnamed protein product [Enterobius vermicularis]
MAFHIVTPQEQEEFQCRLVNKLKRGLTRGIRSGRWQHKAHTPLVPQVEITHTMQLATNSVKRQYQSIAPELNRTAEEQNDQKNGFEDAPGTRINLAESDLRGLNLALTKDRGYITRSQGPGKESTRSDLLSPAWQHTETRLQEVKEGNYSDQRNLLMSIDLEQEDHHYSHVAVILASVNMRCISAITQSVMRMEIIYTTKICSGIASVKHQYQLFTPVHMSQFDQLTYDNMSRMPVKIQLALLMETLFARGCDRNARWFESDTGISRFSYV